MRPSIIHLALMSCLAWSGPLYAEHETDEQTTDQLVTFSGFGTIGAIHNQGDGAAFFRDLTEAKGVTNKGLSWEIDSRIGIQATIKPAENMEGVAQIISRYRTDNNFQPELTWGFLKYSFNDIVEVRAGRIGFDVFLDADSRDIGYSYLMVRPPVEYYGAIPCSYFDGGDIAFRTPMGNGVSRFKLYSGLARQHVSSLLNQTQWAGNITLNTGSTEDLSGSRIIGGLIDFQDNNWILRLSKADLRISHEFPVGQFDIFSLLHSSAQSLAPTDPTLAGSLNALANDISLSGKHITYTSLALAYTSGPLRTQMALSHYGSKSLLFPPADSGYLSIGYRYGKFTPYVTASAITSKRSSRADELAGKGIDSIVDVTNFMITTGHQVQHTLSLGTRYELVSNVALKFQVDMIRNKTCSPVSLPLIGPSPPCAPPLLFSTVPVSWDGHATVYSAVVDFTF